MALVEFMDLFLAMDAILSYTAAWNASVLSEDNVTSNSRRKCNFFERFKNVFFFYFTTIGLIFMATYCHLRVLYVLLYGLDFAVLSG